MENFPVVKEPQVVLYRAESSTGIVLDDQFKYDKKDPSQKTYTVFNSIEEATEYVKSIFKIRSDTEFIILDSANKVLKCFSPS